MALDQYTNLTIQPEIASAGTAVEEEKYSKLAESYEFNGYKRFYLVHIRKAGGTSLNYMFLSLSGEESSARYSQLSSIPDHRFVFNGLIYVGWNVNYINNGNYFYAFSHVPLHKLAIPKGTFTISCFRDPVKRVISHYNMLMHHHINKIDHPMMATEGKWIGESFDDFLRNIPKEHLTNQLYMFSKNCNIDEAVNNVRQLSHYFFIDNFAAGIDGLNRKTGLNLKPIHTRKAKHESQISDHNLEKLREMLDEEYRFLDILRDLQKT
jgi:hypothetical protein